ncbi:hypothetical protein GF380_01800 [Candidatus Uhrbacteria bacterium]|nr:hypothetical protein [Candidatus Uhrbacteria bacterium]
MDPNVILRVDQAADLQMAKAFLRYGKYQERFFPKELHVVLDNDVPTRTKDRHITTYTKQYYDDHFPKITKGVALTKKRWKRFENAFYKLTNRIFDHHPWPEGDYTGTASIFRMYPRDIRRREFFFPYDCSGHDPLSTIAHEMLHFMFFAYLYHRFRLRESSRISGKPTEYIWQLSEAFNTVIENWEPYMKLVHATKKIKPYPECASLYRSLSRSWSTHQSVSKLLQDQLG